MTAMSIRLPQSLHRNARDFAEREGVSMNQLITSALAEKLAALGAEEYLTTRAARGSRELFDAALAQVPDVEPDAGDQMGPGRVEGAQGR
jgi:hypothetical protein